MSAIQRYDIRPYLLGVPRFFRGEGRDRVRGVERESTSCLNVLGTLCFDDIFSELTYRSLLGEGLGGANHLPSALLVVDSL